MQRVVLYFMVGIIFYGCVRKANSVQELLDYSFSQRNGLCKVVQKGDVRIEFVYRPTDLIVAQEIKGRKLSPYGLDSMRSLYKNLDYFLMKIRKKGAEIETYYARYPDKFALVNSYLSSGIAEDVKLIHRLDTISARAAIHTRTFGSNLSTDVLIAFESSLRTKSGSVQMLFIDSMFESGLHAVEFDIVDIKSVPTLDLNNQSL